MEENKTAKHEAALHAEQAVLGAILIDARCLVDIQDKVSASDFDLQQNRYIYEAVMQLQEENVSIDPVVVLDRMAQLHPEQDGMRDYVLQLMEITPTSANAGRYAGIVAKYARERKVQALLQAVIDGGDTQIPAARAALEEAAALDQAEPEAPIDAIGNFLDSIYSEAYKPIPTGIASIDDLLYGGFMRQTLVLLGAPPATGKTMLATMILEKMAAAGHDVLYFNLEMSRQQLMARSVSRIIYQCTGIRMASLKVMQGYRHSAEERSLVRRATEKYLDEIAPHIVYNPGNGAADLDKIIQTITRAGEVAKATGKPAPIVCIDYLQLLSSERKEDTQDLLKRAIAMFKDYARKYDTIVFVIQAQSRSVNESEEATMQAGRDTSALEYTADLQIQLKRQKPATDETGTPLTDEPPVIRLYLTKNRFGDQSTTKYYPYYFLGDVSMFIPVDTVHEAPAETRGTSRRGRGQNRRRGAAEEPAQEWQHTEQGTFELITEKDPALPF